jgi:hypothetical protein
LTFCQIMSFFSASLSFFSTAAAASACAATEVCGFCVGLASEGSAFVAEEDFEDSDCVGLRGVSSVRGGCGGIGGGGERALDWDWGLEGVVFGRGNGFVSGVRVSVATLRTWL